MSKDLKEAWKLANETPKIIKAYEGESILGCSVIPDKLFLSLNSLLNKLYYVNISLSMGL